MYRGTNSCHLLVFRWQLISAAPAPTTAFLPLHHGEGGVTLRDFALGLIFSLAVHFLIALPLPLKKQLIPPCYHQGAYYADNKGHLLGFYPQEKEKTNNNNNAMSQEKRLSQYWSTVCRSIKANMTLFCSTKSFSQNSSGWCTMALFNTPVIDRHDTKYQGG